MRSPSAVVLVLGVSLVAACFAHPTAVTAQVTRVSTGDGWWYNDATWSPPGAPTLADDVIIQADDRIHVQRPVAAQSIVNHGIIDHPQGHITADRRVTILLMIGAIDSLVNYGEIYGYNAGSGWTDRNEIVPPSVLLTVTGDPFDPTPEGRLVNRGLIQAGDGYRRGQTIVPGGGVIMRGRPRVWDSWPGAVNVAGPFIECVNRGTVAAGWGIGSGGAGVGGSVVIGSSPTGRDVDAPYVPFTLIENTGVVESGGGGEFGGNVFLMAADAMGLQAMGGSGGMIIGDGGQILGGAMAATSFVTTCLADNMSFSGPGTLIDGAHAVGFCGWDAMNWGAMTTMLVDLDEGAVHAPSSPNDPLRAGGSTIESIAATTDMQGNPAGTPVLVAEPGASLPANIRVSTGLLLLDPAVTLPDITDPPSEPVLWWPLREGPSTAREDDIDPLVMLWPAGTPPDTTMRTPGHGLGSPGDTASLWYRVWGNRRMHGVTSVVAYDSLGYPIIIDYEPVDHDSVVCAIIEVDVVIPPWAEIGTIDPIYIEATYNDTPPVVFEFRDLLHVVPTVNLIAECAEDGFFGPGSDPFDGRIDCSVRNEGRDPNSFHVEVWDSEGWDIQQSFTDCWLPARSETVLHVDIGIPSWAEPVDTVWFGGYDPIRAANRDEVHVVVSRDAYTGVGDVPGLEVVTLWQNVPNPFNPRTEIRFALPAAGAVDLAIYDVSGRLVRTLVRRKELPAGPHVRVWDGTNESGERVSSGVYFCRLEGVDRATEQKMVLLK